MVASTDRRSLRIPASHRSYPDDLRRKNSACLLTAYGAIPICVSSPAADAVTTKQPEPAHERAPDARSAACDDRKFVGERHRSG